MNVWVIYCGKTFYEIDVTTDPAAPPSERTAYLFTRPNVRFVRVQKEQPVMPPPPRTKPKNR